MEYMYRLRRMLVWIRRWRYSRGFGIQSPSSYRFVRYVVNEHAPYYAYSVLRRMHNVSKKQQKLLRLYLRIANHCQANLWVDSGGLLPASYTDYIKAGCQKTQVRLLDEMAEPFRLQVGRLLLSGDFRDSYERFVACSDSRSLLIIEGIHQSRITRRFWRQIECDIRTGVTFDLYYCGIVFFDLKRYKQNYIVNF